MSRFIKRYTCNGNSGSYMNFINQFFLSNGFVYKNYHGEDVYQKGNGLMVGPKFVKIIPMGDIIRVEAWVKFAILPGVYSGEMDLKGTVGVATKKPLKTIMTDFENQLLQMGCTPIKNMQVPHDQQPQYAQPTPQAQYTPPAQRTQTPTQPVYQTPPQQATASANRFCVGCGYALASNAKFCIRCGKKVN